MYSVILQFVSALFSTKQQAVLSCAGSRDKLWKTVHRWQNCCPAVLIFMYRLILQFVSALFSAKQQAVLSCAGNRDKLWKTIIIIVYKYRISRSTSRVSETQNSSQKIDLDLYPGHKKYCPGVDFFFTCLQYLFWVEVLQNWAQVQYLVKRKYMSLINKIKFERVCLYKTCQNPVTTANHVRKTFMLVIQSKNPSLRCTLHAS